MSLCFLLKCIIIIINFTALYSIGLEHHKRELFTTKQAMIV